MTVSLRNSQKFREYTLGNIYGFFKTHKLDIKWDEEIEKNDRKEKFVALVVDDKKSQANIDKSGATNL